MRAPPVALALLAGAALAGLAPAPAARAQFDLDISTVDPTTKLPAEKWVQLVTRIVNAKPLLGHDAVYMVNATGEDLVVVTCGAYQLVGEAPYITGNKTSAAPKSLPKWTAALVPTEGFNKYCSKGVDATGAVVTYHGELNAADKSFANSTFVVFLKPKV